MKKKNFSNSQKLLNKLPNKSFNGLLRLLC